MVKWYFETDGAPNGPHLEDDIRRLFVTGRINGETMVWREGMADWAPLHLQEPFADLTPVPPSLSAKRAPIGTETELVGATAERQPEEHAALDEPEMTVQETEARDDELDSVADVRTKDEGIFVGNSMGSLHFQGGPWSRYFARQFDLTVLGTVAAFAIELTLPNISPAAYVEYANAPTVGQGFILLIIATFLNGVVSGIFGRSIGKTMFGLRPMPVDGRLRLSFFEHIVREFRVWFAGLACGVAIIALFTMWKNYSEVSVGRSAVYDRQFARMEVTRIGAARRAIAMIFTALVVLGVSFLGVYGETLARQESSTQITWTNPDTGLSVQLHGDWIAEPMTLEDGSRMHVFSRGTSIVAYLAMEQDPSFALTLDEYVEAVRANVTSVDHVAPAVPVNVDGVTMQAWEGNLRSAGWPGAYFVYKEGNSFWRIIVFLPGADSEVSEQAIPTAVALKRTIVR